MSLSQIDYLCKLVEDQIGLHLTKDKLYLVESRLAPVLRDYKIESLAALETKLRAPGSVKLTADVIEALVTHESFFFRDVYPFTYLEKMYLPDIIQRKASHRSLRIWCAGASTGQEPYSVALLISEKFPELKSWNIELIATDVSNKIVNQAQAGIFSHLEVQRGLPPEYFKKYFQPSGRSWQISREIRSMVRFEQRNLQDYQDYPTNIDILMCRNVMLYFQPAMRRRIMEQFVQTLVPKGVLIVGNTETMLGNGLSLLAAPGQAGIFMKSTKSAA